jgi:hypothetical protein
MRKSWWTFAVVCLLTVSSATAQPRERKHIDALSGPELDAFAKAIQFLKDLPANHPNNYMKWANIHGYKPPIGGGPCEHGSEVIWAWHRAYLLAFEDVLRATIPGVTDSVTIPYWNWSEPPSGSRYPKAFETRPELQVAACSVSAAPCRNKTPHPAPPIDPVDLAHIQAIPNWKDYGGPTKASGGGKGTLELQLHDTIHGTYIAGSNSTPATAARDPLFWAHHSYMDWLWAQWQAAHPGSGNDPVCLSCGINFLPGKTVGDYLDIAILNYRYVPRTSDDDMLESVAAPAKRRARALMVRVPAAPSVVEIPVTVPPAAQIARASLLFRGITVPTDASYLVKVYLRRAPANPATRSDADLLVFFTSWRTDPEHDTHA